MDNKLPENFQPLSYEPSFEQPSPDEAQLISEILKVLADVREKTYAHSGYAMRSVHVKSHGILKGELKVLDNLPSYLAQGIFKQAKNFPVIVRFSSAPGDVLPDSVSTPRGFSVKVFDVEGERLIGSEEDKTQNFILVNDSPVFPQKLKDFLSGLKRFDAMTDKVDGLKSGVSKVLRTVGKVSEKLGGPAAIMPGLGGQPETNLLGDTYYSQAAFLYGDYMAKMSIAPVSPELKALTKKALELDDDKDAIRTAVKEYFEKNDAKWEVRIQLSVDIDKMPVEDISVEWKEEMSPFITVARLTIPKQDAWNEEKSALVDDRMSFSPWQGIAAHRPLGVIQRARKPAYRESAAFRAHFYGKSEEKADVEKLPE